MHTAVRGLGTWPAMYLWLLELRISTLRRGFDRILSGKWEALTIQGNIRLHLCDILNVHLWLIKTTMAVLSLLCESRHVPKARQLNEVVKWLKSIVFVVFFLFLLQKQDTWQSST